VELRTGEEKPYKFPARCPSCGEKLERREGESATYCVNPLCPAQLIRGLVHFAGRDAMDIEGNARPCLRRNQPHKLDRAAA